MTAGYSLTKGCSGCANYHDPVNRLHAFQDLGESFLHSLGVSLEYSAYNYVSLSDSIYVVQRTLSVLGTFFTHVLSQSPMYTTDGCHALATW